MLTNNRVYKILPVQIPQFWDAIKFACAQADEVKKEDAANYYNELLQLLLSDKAQCFVALDEKNILHSIGVTRILVDKVQDRKELCIQCLYSMSMISDEDLQRYFNFVIQFAKTAECKVITYNSKNPRIWQIATTIGCTERYRSFSYNLGGL